MRSLFWRWPSREVDSNPPSKCSSPPPAPFNNLRSANPLFSPVAAQKWPTSPTASSFPVTPMRKIDNIRAMIPGFSLTRRFPAPTRLAASLPFPKNPTTNPALLGLPWNKSSGAPFVVYRSLPVPMATPIPDHTPFASEYYRTKPELLTRDCPRRFSNFVHLVHKVPSSKNNTPAPVSSEPVHLVHKVRLPQNNIPALVASDRAHLVHKVAAASPHTLKNILPPLTISNGRTIKTPPCKPSKRLVRRVCIICKISPNLRQRRSRTLCKICKICKISHLTPHRNDQIHPNCHPQPSPQEPFVNIHLAERLDHAMGRTATT
jgi:hypothetical protein